MGWKGEARFAYLSVLPAFILLFALTAYPILYSIWVSLHKYKLTLPGRGFIGVQNFLSVLKSWYFVGSLQVSLLFVVGSVVVVTLLSLGIALLLNERFRGNGLLRILILVPWAIPPVANALMWKWIYNPQYGLLNAVLVYVLGVMPEYYTFLSDINYALPLVLVAHVWRETPLCVILFLTGLTTIPKSVYEAAVVDGANALTRFKSVTLPMLKPVAQIVIIFTSITAINLFDLVYVLTGGGPGGATNNLAWRAFENTFYVLDFGAGSAVAIILALICIALIYLYIKLLPTREFGVV